MNRRVIGRGRACLCMMAAALALLPATSAHGLVLDTDSEQYDPGQAIMIFGNVGVVPTGNQVVIEIFNDDNNNRVYTDQAGVDEAGEFEAVANIPRVDGWYIIRATYDGVSALRALHVGQLAVPVEPEGVEPAVPAFPEVPVVAERPEPETFAPVRPPEPDNPIWLGLLWAINMALEWYLDQHLAVKVMLWLAISLVSMSVLFLLVDNLKRALRRMIRGSVMRGNIRRPPIPSTRPSGGPGDGKTDGGGPGDGKTDGGGPGDGKTDGGGPGDGKILDGRTVVFDTNMCIDYMFHRIPKGDKRQQTYVKHKRSEKMNDNLPDAIDAAIADGRFCMPKTTIREFRRKLRRKISDNDKKDMGFRLRDTITMYQLVEKEFAQLRENSRLIQILMDSPKISNISGYGSHDLERARGMRKKLEGRNYLGILSPSLVKESGDMLDDGDLEILATAMSFSGKRGLPTCLLTMDGDFINNRETILGELGVDIVSGYKPE